LDEQAKRGNIQAAPAGADAGSDAVLLARAAAVVRRWWWIHPPVSYVSSSLHSAAFSVPEKVSNDDVQHKLFLNAIFAQITRRPYITIRIKH
jgi:hypothetical protein